MEYLFILLGLMLLLFILGIPVGVSIGLTCVVVLIAIDGFANIPYELFAFKMLSGLNSFPILAAPLFIFAATLMNSSSVTGRIFDLANGLVGHLRGGLAHVNVVASVLFGSMSSSAVADAAGLGQLEIKAMRDRGYPLWLTTGITGASSIIGAIIPPSMALIIYGWLSSTSISALFAAGLLPGLVLTLALMAAVLVISFRVELPLREERPSIHELVHLIRRAVLPMMTPVIIIGGIWSGQFTPTESGAMASVYALFLGLVVYRDIRWKQLVQALRTTVLYSSIILYIIAIATFYGWLAIRLQIPQELAAILTMADLSPTILLLGFVAFFLVVGCFMSVLEAVLIFTPIFVVPVMTLGIDPVYFGILMAISLSVGVITPPFGNVIFVLASITGQSFVRVVLSLLPFLIPILATIVIIVLVPSIVTFLPTYMR